jgi:hypothetical protein
MVAAVEPTNGRAERHKPAGEPSKSARSATAERTSRPPFACPSPVDPRRMIQVVFLGLTMLA